MPAGVINTGSHPMLLWPGVHATWGQMYNEHATEYTDLFDIEDSEMAYERDVQVTGFGLAPIKPEGSGGTYDSEVQGYVTNYVHIPYSLGYIVTKEEMDDNLYEKVSMNRAKANAFSINQTVENIAAFLYNTAFSTTYFTTADGASLISTTHGQPLGGTFSNALSPAADLSEAALEDLTIQIMHGQSSRGLRIAILPESLHVSVDDWYNANRIIKSVLQSNTSSNNINVLNAVNAFPKGIKMNHYFTNPHAWFIRTNVQNGMRLFWRARPAFAQDNDFDTKNAKALAYFRMSVGCTDPLSIWGSNGP